MDDNNKDNNHDKVISALELYRDVWFSRGHQAIQGHRPHDDDNEEEEDEVEVEDNNKEDDNNKDDNDENGISAQGPDRDLGFS